MGIWIWIVLSWVITKIALGKKKISLEHYVWMLLPVDMYGINVLGVTVKPYMLFCVLLFMRTLWKGNAKLYLRSRWGVLGGILSILVVCVNFINNNSWNSPKAAVMIFLVWFCAIVYLSNCKENSWMDIEDIIVATGIGYGAVFILGQLIMTAGISIQGIVASERSQAGFILQFSNMYEGSLLNMTRLRGFTIDPNTMIGTFCFCSVICIMKIIKQKGSFREWIGLIFSLVCVLLSNSRMGLICYCLLVLLSIVAGYRIASRKTRTLMKKIGIIFVLVILLIFIMTDIPMRVTQGIIASYANRSGLNDRFGRFTIWKEAVHILMNSNFLIGIGMGQMQFHTSVERACHNTWLEIICGDGFIIGGAFVLFFFFLILVGIRSAMRCTNNILLWSMALSTFIVTISLITVDNVTYSYLWFGSMVLAAIMNKRE